MNELLNNQDVQWFVEAGKVFVIAGGVITAIVFIAAAIFIFKVWKGLLK